MRLSEPEQAVRRGPSNGKRGPLAGSQIGVKRAKGVATPPVSQSVVPLSTGGINLDPVKSENDKIYAELAAAKARILGVAELCDLTTATPDTGPLNIDEGKAALQNIRSTPPNATCSSSTGTTPSPRRWR